MMEPRQQIISYYKRLGFQEGEGFIIRASGKKQRVLFGKLGESSIRLWNAEFYQTQDNLATYRQTQEIPDPVARLRELGRTHDIQSYPNHISPREEGQFLTLGSFGNRDAEQFDTFFWEIDDLPLDEQRQRREWFTQVTGIDVAVSVFSGGKSEHNYLASARPCTVEEWTRINRKICCVLQGDTAISTPARAMRLPGVPRVKAGITREVEIVHESEFKVDPEVLEAELDKLQDFPYGISDERWRKLKSIRGKGKEQGLTHQEYWNEAKKILTIPEHELNPIPAYESKPSPIEFNYNGDTIPLEICLTRDDQSLISSGVSAGGIGRNPMAYKIACNAIATANRLDNLGIRHSNNARQLVEEFCSRCNPSIPTSEIDVIWKQALKSNLKPSLPDEQLKKRVSYWQWLQNKNNPSTDTVKRTDTDKRNDEPDSFNYEKYLQWEAEQELIDENEEEYRDEQQKDNLCNYIKSRIRKLKRFTNWKKAIEKSGKQLPPIPEAKNELIYHPDKELPRPEDFKNNGLTLPKIIFKKGQRLEVISRLKQAGWQFVKDNSFMGLGKSHDAGLFFAGNGDEDSEYDATGEASNTVWYLDLNHTNPSTSTVEGMENMMPRHNGMSFVEGRTTPSGQPHLRHTKEGQTPDVSGNCIETKTFNTLQQKGYDPNTYKQYIKDENGKYVQRNQVCLLCKHRGTCHTEKNNESGYLLEREQAFSAERIRASIDSLPPEGSNFSNDIAFVEEASSYLRGTKSLTATESDLAKLFWNLERKDSDTFNLLAPLRFALQDAFNGEFNQIIKGINRGASHNVLMENFPSFKQLLNLSFATEDEIHTAKHDLLNAVKATIPTVEEIIQQPDSVIGLGGKWKKAGETARRIMKAEAHQQTEENIENLPPNILGDFIGVWLGLQNGALRVEGKKLTVTTVDPKHSYILKSMKFVDLLDATGSKNHLAKVLDVDPNEIIEIAQETPDLSNLQVININLQGMGSRKISEQCKQRQTAFVDWIKTQHWDANVKILGYKSDTHLAIDGHWFHDNRATNAFKGTEVIVVFNSPRMNLGVAQDEYLALYGSLDGFEEYYRNLMKDEVIQLIGRQRAHLKPDCKYLIYLVGTNQDVSYLTEEFGIRVINKEMIEVCKEAAKPGDRTLKMIFDTTTQLLKESSNLAQVTCQRVGDAIGKSKQTVSKAIKQEFGSWPEFKRCLLNLLDIYTNGGQAKDLKSQWKFVKNEENPDGTWIDVDDLDDSTMQELERLAHTYLPVVVKDDPPDELLSQLGALWSYGEFAFTKLVSLLSSDLRQKLAKIMLLALGTEFSTEILAEFGEGVP